MAPDCAFERDAGRFVPTDAARSPWSPDLLHGGPVGGLLAHAVEGTLPDPEMLVARLTVDLFRPVPAQPLAVQTSFVREGRRIAVAQASLYAGEVEVTRAHALMLRPNGIELPDASRFRAGGLPDPEGTPIGSFWETGLDGDEMPPGFHAHIEVRPFRNEAGPYGGRSVAAWLRLPFPLIKGETMSPFVHAASLADFANGLGSVRSGPETTFVNTDITLHLNRRPEGQWVCMEVESGANSNGIGNNRAVLSDTDGPFGMVAESLLATPSQ